MDSRTLLEQMKKEHADLGSAIAVLESRIGGSSAPAKRSQSGTVKRHGRVMSAAAKAAMSKRLKQVWAAKRAKAEARSKAAKKAATARKPARKAS